MQHGMSHIKLVWSSSKNAKPMNAKTHGNSYNGGNKENRKAM